MVMVPEDRLREFREKGERDKVGGGGGERKWKEAPPNFITERVDTLTTEIELPRKNRER